MQGGGWRRVKSESFAKCSRHEDNSNGKYVYPSNESEVVCGLTKGGTTQLGKKELVELCEDGEQPTKASALMQPLVGFGTCSH